MRPTPTGDLNKYRTEEGPDSFSFYDESVRNYPDRIFMKMTNRQVRWIDQLEGILEDLEKARRIRVRGHDPIRFALIKENRTITKQARALGLNANYFMTKHALV